MPDEVVPATGRISWILECGCDPVAGHCAQCDRRRELVAEAKDREEEARLVALLRAKGYEVERVGRGDLLTGAERSLLGRLGTCWNLLCEVVGDGPTRAGDLDELAVHVHALQTALMGQAAARAYPGVYRLLGGEPARSGDTSHG